MRVLGRASTPAQPAVAKKKRTISEAITDTLGLHGAVDTIGANLATLAHPKLAAKGFIDQPDLKKNIGAGLSIGSTIASLAAPGTPGLVKNAAQFGLLSAAQGGGAALAEGDDIGTSLTDAAKSGIAGAAVGGTFNLLGKALRKGGPAALSFTSGVPKDAIEQAARNPTAAKEGLHRTVEKIRHQAVGSLQSLYSDLGSEFSSGLKEISEKLPVSKDAPKIAPQLLTDAQNIAAQFKIAAKPTKEGLIADFSKSAIVKGGETTAVQHTFDTLSSWTDFSPQGMQDLEARIGALRNFDSGGQTRSSAIVGKVYNTINDTIKTHYPALAELRSGYARNRQALDEISNVLSATKDTPVSVQSSITRLSNIFKADREQYVNIIRALGERSGTDYLSLIAGTEFQNVLPGFIRGVGGGSAVGVGAAALNPYLLLLAPLFSPRVAGLISRNAPKAAKATAPLLRSVVTQTIPQLSKARESE